MRGVFTVCLFILGVFTHVGSSSGGHPLRYITDGESEKGPPSFGKSLGLFDFVGSSDDVILQRHIRAAETETTEAPEGDKDFFEKISDFYADNNNMAMYLVLPLMCLVYGGCCAIFCIAKCRRYLRRRKHKKPSGLEERLQLDPDERNNLNQTDAPVTDLKQTTKPNVLASSGDIQVNMERENSTPLPWQIPEEENGLVKGIQITPAAAAVPVNPSAPFEQQRDLNSRESPVERDVVRRNYRDIVEAAKKKEISSSPPDYGEPRPITIIKRPGYDNDGFERSPKHMKRTDSSEYIPLTERLERRSRSRNAYRMNSASDDRDGSVSTVSFKEELMAKYDALSTFAMAKKAADILRMNNNNNNKSHTRKKQIDPMTGKPKHKLIFIAE